MIFTEIVLTKIIIDDHPEKDKKAGMANPRKCGGFERNSVFEIDHEVYVDTANGQRKFFHNSIFQSFLTALMSV